MFIRLPKYLFPETQISFMGLPKPYQEFLVRLYYYDNTDETDIPPTVPVEHIEDYIVNHMKPQLMWCAKGFAIARNVDDGDNLDFKNDGEFHIFCLYVARLYFVYGVQSEWFAETISKTDFEKACYPLHGIHI